MKSSDKSLHDDIMAFTRAHRMTETGFGRKAVRDPNLLVQLRAGRSPTGRTVDRIRAFMNGYRNPTAGTKPRR